eukprot:gene18520-20378_t
MAIFPHPTTRNSSRLSMLGIILGLLWGMRAATHDVRNGDKISYPIHIEQTACQLLRPNWNYLDMCVVDVQQQKGGVDCGLFAIVFAAALSLGKSPIKATIQQDMLREALVHSFEMREISHLVDSALVPSTADTKPVMFHWNCKVYCHCRMPDDGKLMVPCNLCRQWFHALPVKVAISISKVKVKRKVGAITTK